MGCAVFARGPVEKVELEGSNSMVMNVRHQELLEKMFGSM